MCLLVERAIFQTYHRPRPIGEQLGKAFGEMLHAETRRRTEEDIAQRVLELERKLAAYRKAHAEELDELRQLMSELKDDVLVSRGEQEAEGGR